ncbi:MAG TPA: PHP domain-containing protein, partial [bacterium]|nr:PHP domain-containing protein [bacterium]
MPAYAPLWCKSNFSFLEGASHPEELIEQAHALGLPALAVTDRDGVYGMVRAWVKAKELGIKLIVGSQVTLDDGTCLVLLAGDRTGYANLCRLLTAGRLRCSKGESAVTWREVCGHAPGLIALWGGETSLLAREDEPGMAGELKDAFGDRLYALAARHRRAADRRHERLLRERAERWGLPVVAGVEVLYHTPERRPLQDILTCIRHGVPIHAAGRRIRANAQYALLAGPAFGSLFADDAAAVARTLEVAARCTFSLAELRYRYPSERLPDGATSAEWLRTLTFRGAEERYPGGVPEEVRLQLDRELALIQRLDYCG